MEHVGSLAFAVLCTGTIAHLVYVGRTRAQVMRYHHATTPGCAMPSPRTTPIDAFPWRRTGSRL